MRQLHNTLLTVLLLLSSYNICVAQSETYPFQRGDGDRNGAQITENN